MQKWRITSVKAEIRSIGIDLWKLPSSFEIPKELCLCSQTLGNVQYIISNYFLSAMMYFGNRKINKTKFLLHGQFSWHFILLGKYGLNHTVLVTASPGTHDGGLHRYSFPTAIASLQSHFAFCRELCFLLYQWEGWYRWSVVSALLVAVVPGKRVGRAPEDCGARQITGNKDRESEKQEENCQDGWVALEKHIICGHLQHASCIL